jgi:predicted nuclease of predicted toxin-antitoxin system
MKLLYDESLSPKLVELLDDLFPGSESALLNGLARAGDRRILRYACEADSCWFRLTAISNNS